MKKRAKKATRKAKKHGRGASKHSKSGKVKKLMRLAKTHKKKRKR